MDKKFILSVLLFFVVSMCLGFFTHAWILSAEYQATGLFRPDAEAEAYLPYMLLAHVIMAFAFVWIYRRGREDKPWVSQGVRFGVAVALLTAVPLYLIYYAVQPMPEMLVLRQISYETVNMVILGLVVAWMYR